MWAEICKKEILSTQLGIGAAIEDFDDVKTFIDYAPMNLLTIFTNVAVTAISFNGKYTELTISHGQKHLHPMTLPHWTKQNVFPSLSPTTSPFVPSHPLFANTCTSLFHPTVAIHPL